MDSTKKCSRLWDSTSLDCHRGRRQSGTGLRAKIRSEFIPHDELAEMPEEFLGSVLVQTNAKGPEYLSMGQSGNDRGEDRSRVRIQI